MSEHIGQTPDNPEPLPCPFCGAAPVVDHYESEQFGTLVGEVFCDNDECYAQPRIVAPDFECDELNVDSMPEDFKRAAVARWNRRS